MNPILAIFLKDKRDSPFLLQIFLTTIFVIPCALLIILFPEVSWWIALPYAALIVFFMGPHLLMLHNICHRNPWTKKVKTFLDTYVSLLGLFFGLPPMLYYLHHIKMHHKEGNGPHDLSSTERYRRDSFIGWLRYFARFALLIPIELPLYFIKRGRKDFAFKAIFGFVIFYSCMFTLYSFNPKAFFILQLLPTAICWFGLMGGNWAQHAFVDTRDKDNEYKNSITIVGGLYNKRCFNDGFHIGHHLYPGMHWTEMPGEFEKNKDKYYANDAIVFRDIDYQFIWLLLMLKQYKFLAKFYLPKEGQTVDRDTVVKKIKDKMQPTKEKQYKLNLQTN